MIRPCLRQSEQWPRLPRAAFCFFFVICWSVGFIRGTTQAQGLEQTWMAEEAPITVGDRDHWAFRPCVSPTLPSNHKQAWPRGGIDCFVLDGLERAGLHPAREADRATLLRRLKLDLLGLPPTPQELDDFLQDDREQAYEIRVDRWLNSPRFGESWSQAWLDLARFAETDGFEHDKVRKDAWQYRDWVISAFNGDMSYDRFVRLQLAGDLTGNRQDQVATMFCLAGADMPDINDQDLRRHDRLNELTSTIGAVFLGLQMNCAQCHDHKYDPISQADFYRLRAVFESAIPILERDQPLAVFDGDDPKIVARLYHRGDLSSPGPVVPAAFPRIAVAPGDPYLISGNRPRESLVQWMFSRENVLTSRVIANRIWQSHFGRGLLENSSDFGVISGGPSHPELLDWLASFLVEHDWSLKALHREIVLSATYRQASRRDATAENNVEWDAKLTQDPENRLLGCYPRHRLSGEAIRDSLLEVSGLLDLAMGGPGIRPPLPPELSDTLLSGQWSVDPVTSEHYRRSIYVFARRNLRYPVFEVFDRPDAAASCPQRSRSTTALQSLQMMNSPFALQCATAFANRVTQAANANDLSSDGPWIEQLYRIGLSRSPLGFERQLFAEFFSQGGSKVNACLAVLNTSEFVYRE